MVKRPITLRTTLRYILDDLSRYHLTEKRSYLAIAIMCPGAIAGIYYRLGYWIWNYDGALAPLIGLLRPAYIVGKRIIEIYSGCSISVRAHIGRGLYINHFGSIFVGAVEIGENCNLSHEVTLGVGGRGDRKGLPTLGDRVYIAAGAKLIGAIHIGSDAAIGANAVVTKSIPECAVAAGVPAQVISYQGSFDFVIYKGMENDPARQQALMRSHERRVSTSEQQHPSAHAMEAFMQR